MSSKLTLTYDWTLNSGLLLAAESLESLPFGTGASRFVWKVLKPPTSPAHYSLYLVLADESFSALKVPVKGQLRVKFGNSGEELVHPLAGDVTSSISTTQVSLLQFSRLDLDCRLTTTLDIQINSQKQPEIPKKPKILLPGSVDHLIELSRQLAEYQLNVDQSADLIVVTKGDGREFPVHRWVLSMRSSVLREMLQKDPKKIRLEIEDVKGEVMESLIGYLYSGDVEKIDVGLAEELLQVAVKYQISLLVDYCISQLIPRLTIDNAARLFAFASTHALEPFQSSIAVFINANRTLVRQTSDWSALIQPNAALLNQLFTLMDDAEVASAPKAKPDPRKVPSGSQQKQSPFMFNGGSSNGIFISGGIHMSTNGADDAGESEGEEAKETLKDMFGINTSGVKSMTNCIIFSGGKKKL